MPIGSDTLPTKLPGAGGYFIDLAEELGLGENLVRYYPTPPSNLSVSVSGSDLLLKWTDNSWNEDGFRIYKKTLGTDFVLYAEVPTDTTTYIDSNAANNSITYYYVTTYQGTLESLPSNVAVGVVLSDALPTSSFALARDWEIYEKVLSETLGLDSKFDWAKLVPPIDLADGALLEDLSGEKNHAYAYQLQLQQSTYSPNTYSKWEYLAKLLQSQGTYATDYPLYQKTVPQYQYAIFVFADPQHGTADQLRTRVKKLLSELKTMHPAGKTAFIYIYTSDYVGRGFDYVYKVQEEISGLKYFDDGETFDSDNKFDQMGNPIDDSLQEISITDYVNFDDGERFDQIGKMQQVYPCHLKWNQETPVFDDGERFDSENNFDQIICVNNCSIPVPELPENPDSESDFVKTRFDIAHASYHATVEFGRDI